MDGIWRRGSNGDCEELHSSRRTYADGTIPPDLGNPTSHEREDSAALAEWLQDQPWTPECVIASGASYAAGTAWAFAAETNSADRSFRVDGVVSKVPTIGSDRVKRDPSGILLLAEHLAWWGEHGDSSSSREGFIPALMRSDSSLLEHLPVQSMIEEVGLTSDSPGWLTAIPSRS